MADEALTVKGQSLFLFLKATHSPFCFVFGIIKLPNTGGSGMGTIYDENGGRYEVNTIQQKV